MGNAGQLKQHHEELRNIQAPVNGYVYVYVSNESGSPVFFDNLQVVHTQGAMMEKMGRSGIRLYPKKRIKKHHGQNHYYLFGLMMAGISNKANGKLENKRKFNDGTELENKEFSDGTETNTFYDAKSKKLIGTTYEHY